MSIYAHFIVKLIALVYALTNYANCSCHTQHGIGYLRTFSLLIQRVSFFSHICSRSAVAYFRLGPTISRSSAGVILLFTLQHSTMISFELAA